MVRNQSNIYTHSREILVSAAIFVTGVVIGYLINANYSNDYVSKPRLCEDFSQKYLSVVRTNENALPDSELPNERSKWEMAVDIETDFYNLCMLNLDSESMQQYKSSVMTKYQKLIQ